nr:hypothetical protein CFP56_21574 [Quercus suber]
MEDLIRSYRFRQTQADLGRVGQSWAESSKAYLQESQCWCRIHGCRAFTYAQEVRVAALVVTVSPDPADHFNPFESVGMTPCNRLQTFIVVMQLQTYGTRHVSSPRTADSVL